MRVKAAPAVKASASLTPGRLRETDADLETLESAPDDADSAEFLTDQLEGLYRDHAEAAWGVANAVLRNPEDAADAVADAFARLAKHPPAVAVGRAYVLAVVRNAAIDIVRRRRRTEGLADLRLAAGAGGSGIAGPLDHVVAHEDAAVVAGAFARLPERWRSALWLIDVEDCSTQEAGVVLGVSPNNAAQLATRARGRLRAEYVQAHVPNHVRPACDRTVGLLGRYAAGTLSLHQRSGVDEHVAGCPECRSRLDALDDLGLKLRRALPPLPLALLRWGTSRRGGRGLWDWATQHAASLPTSVSTRVSTAVANQAAAGVVTTSSPLLERVAAGASAAVLVLGVSSLAVRGVDRVEDNGRRPPAATSVAAGAGPAAGSVSGGGSGSGAASGAGSVGGGTFGSLSPFSPTAGLSFSLGSGGLPAVGLPGSVAATGAASPAGIVGSPSGTAAGPSAAASPLLRGADVKPVLDAAAGTLGSIGTAAGQTVPSATGALGPAVSSLLSPSTVDAATAPVQAGLGAVSSLGSGLTGAVPSVGTALGTPVASVVNALPVDLAPSAGSAPASNALPTVLGPVTDATTSLLGPAGLLGKSPLAGASP